MIVAHDQGLSISQNRGAHLVPPAARQRADVPRHRGQRDPLQRARQQAGRAVVPRAQQQPPRRAAASRAACGTRWAAARAAGPRPIPTDPNIVWSTASGSGMVGGIVVRFDESRRQFRSVEVWPEQSRGPASGRALPLRVGRAAHHLAARPQHRLRGQPARAPHHATAARAGRSSAPTSRSTTRARMGVSRRAHPRQHRRGVRGRGVRASPSRRASRGSSGPAPTTAWCSSRATTAPRGPTSRRTSRTCPRGARCAASRRRATMPAPRTSRWTSTR